MGNASKLVAMLAASSMLVGGACSSSGKGAGEVAGPPEGGEMAPPGLGSSDPAPDSAAAGAGGSTPLTGLPGDAETGAPVDAPLSPEAVPGEGTAGEPAAPSLDGDIRFSEPSGTFESSLSVGIS